MIAYTINFKLGRVESQSRYIERDGQLIYESRVLWHKPNGVVTVDRDWEETGARITNWADVVAQQPELADLYGLPRPAPRGFMARAREWLRALV